MITNLSSSLMVPTTVDLYMEGPSILCYAFMLRSDMQSVHGGCFV